MTKSTIAPPAEAAKPKAPPSTANSMIPRLRLPSSRQSAQPSTPSRRRPQADVLPATPPATPPEATLKPSLIPRHRNLTASPVSPKSARAQSLGYRAPLLHSATAPPTSSHLATPPFTPPEVLLSTKPITRRQPLTKVPLATAVSELATSAIPFSFRRPSSTARSSDSHGLAAFSTRGHTIPQRSLETPQFAARVRVNDQISVFRPDASTICGAAKEQAKNSTLTTLSTNPSFSDAAYAHSPSHGWSDTSSTTPPYPVVIHADVIEELRAENHALKAFISLHGLEEAFLLYNGPGNQAICAEPEAMAKTSLVDSAPQGMSEPQQCADLPPSVPQTLGRSAFTVALGRKTELAQDRFHSRSNDASWAPISQATVNDFIFQGIRLEKKSLFHGSKTLFPETQNKHWPEVPDTVRFGWLDLCKQGLGNGFPEMKSKDISPTIAHNVVHVASKLRNAGAHPEQNYHPRQAKVVDSLLQLGHDLPVVFHQYDIAMEYRELRRSWRGVVDETWQALLTKFENQTPETEFELHEEQVFYSISKDPLGYYDCPEKLQVAAEIWRQGGHPLSQGYPPNGIVEGDDYLRHPGQNDAYFRAKNEPDWAFGSEQFKKIVKENGAPAEIAEASIGELEEQNLEGVSLLDLSLPTNVEEENIPWKPAVHKPSKLW